MRVPFFTSPGVCIGIGIGVGTIQPARCWTPLNNIAVAKARTAHTVTTRAAASGGLEVWADLRKLEPPDLLLGSSSSSSSSSSSLPLLLEEADAAILSAEQASDETTRQSLASFPASRFVATTTSLPQTDGGTDIPRLHQDGNESEQPMGAIVDVSTSSGQDAAVGLIGSLEWIVIACSKPTAAAGTAIDDTGSNDDEGWLMIPAENLISACQGTGTKIAAAVENAGDVGGLADALQLGVDALCVDATKAIHDDKLWTACLDAREAKTLAAKTQTDGTAYTSASSKSGPILVQGSCKRLATPSGKSTVLADRVCIDLVQSLKPTEGCWLGSSAKMMALVLSEAAQSSFVPSRPFRVNAGPVHSYVLMGDGISTKYLSELRAGDEVLVFDVEMKTERSVAVGRLKEEVRPCIQIELSVDIGADAECEGTECDDSIVKGQIFVQQAETVRLGKRRGEASFVRATDLESVTDDAAAVEEILLRVTELGTHVGKAYSGKVQEK